MSKTVKIKPKTRELTIKQQMFVSKYSGDIAEAAKYAGLSYGYGAQLLKLPHIAQAIREKLDRMGRGVEVNQAWILRRYKKLADYKITDFFNDNGTLKALSEISEDAIYAIQGLEVDTKGKNGDSQSVITKFKLPDKRATLESIAKLLGLIIEKKDIGINIDANIMCLMADMVNKARQLPGQDQPVIDVTPVTKADIKKLVRPEKRHKSKIVGLE
jgi:phage terminase small subunit